MVTTPWRTTWQNLLTRKFLISLAVLGTTGWLCWLERLSGAEYAIVVGGVIGLFNISNALAHRQNGSA